jgi:hypothetical protein
LSTPAIKEPTARDFHRFQIELFLYLQVLDVFTTLVGFRAGIAEASPFVRLMVALGPLNGLIAAKIFAAGIALLCLTLRKRHIIRWINYWYGALALWNLFVTLRVLNA